MLMGPNGSGKSTLAYALAGHPRYEITGGRVHLADYALECLPADQRARAGLFLALQHSPEISGVTLFSFLKEAYAALHAEHLSVNAFKEKVEFYSDLLKLDRSFMQRSLHEGFSGGEKKRCEMLQLLVLKPKVAILDEIDSGLDIDGLQQLHAALQFFKKENPMSTLLVITHNIQLARLLRPEHIHVMHRGSLAVSGDRQLLDELERKGYDGLLRI